MMFFEALFWLAPLGNVRLFSSRDLLHLGRLLHTISIMMDSSPASPARTLLLVEDQPLVAMDEARRLRNHGYRVEVVNSGDEAVRKVDEENPVDLVLMDIDLGEGMDGTDASRRILARHELPIVFLTSHTERQMVDRVRNITRYGYVPKDAGDFVLFSTIEMAFDLFHAHRRMTEKEYRLAEAERIAHLGSWEMDIQSGQCRWSDEFFRICGYEPGAFEPTMEKGLELIHPDDRPRAEEAVQRSIETGEPYSIEKRIVRPDGSIRFVQSDGEVEFDGEGRPLRLIGSFLDITERTRAEKERHRRERDLAVTLDSIGEAVITIDEEGRVTRMNPAAQRLTGLSGEESSGIGADELFRLLDIDSRERIENPVRNVLEHGRSISLQGAILVSSSGAEYRISGYAAPLRGERESVSGAVMVLRDITEDSELRREVRSLCERLNAAMSSGDIAWWEMMLPDGSVQFNEQKTRMLGYHPERFTHYSDFTELLHPEDYEDTMEAMRAHLERGAERYDVRYRIRHASGHYRIMHDVGRITSRYADGSPHKITGIVRDVTEEHEAQERIRNLLDEQQLLLREVHHRVKNNLNNIAGLLALQSDSTESREASAALEEAQRRVASMLRIYTQLFRAERYRSVDLGELLPQLAEELRFSMAPSVHSPEVRVAAESIELSADDAFPVGLIVNELLTNSFKYAFPEGAEGGVIEVTATIPDEESVEISVSDNGAGLPEGLDPYESSSFGLTIVRSQAHQLGGELRVEQEKGTCFRVRFPLRSGR